MTQKIRECYPNSIISFYDFGCKPIQDNKTFQNEIKDIQVDELLVPKNDCININQNEPIQEQSSMLCDDLFSSGFDDNEPPIFFD